MYLMGRMELNNIIEIIIIIIMYVFSYISELIVGVGLELRSYVAAKAILGSAKSKLSQELEELEADEETILIEMGLGSTGKNSGATVSVSGGGGGGVSGFGSEVSGGDGDDGDEDIWDLKQQFHNTVRENIVSFMRNFILYEEFF
jgi:hypothetical protein